MLGVCGKRYTVTDDDDVGLHVLGCHCHRSGLCYYICVSDESHFNWRVKVQVHARLGLKGIIMTCACFCLSLAKWNIIHFPLILTARHKNASLSLLPAHRQLDRAISWRTISWKLNPRRNIYTQRRASNVFSGRRASGSDLVGCWSGQFLLDVWMGFCLFFNFFNWLIDSSMGRWDTRRLR